MTQVCARVHGVTAHRAVGLIMKVWDCVAIQFCRERERERERVGMLTGKLQWTFRNTLLALPSLYKLSTRNTYL